MLQTSNQYPGAITGDTRHMLIKATLNLIDPDLTYGTPTASPQDLYGNLDQLYDTNAELTRMASLEHNRWTLDGTVAVRNDEPEIGCETVSLFDADGVGSLTCTLAIGGVTTLQVVGFNFPTHPADGIPEDFTVTIYAGATVLYTETVTGNTETFFQLDGFTANYPTAIELTVTRWSLPDRRMRVAEIIPGTIEYLTDQDFVDFSVQQQGNPSCVLLPYGSCSLTLDNSDRRFDPRSKNSLFQSIEDRLGIEVLLGVDLGAEVEWVPVGTYYLHSGGWRTSTYEMTIAWDLIDIVGLLCDRLFVVPDTLPTTLEGWVAEIVGQLGKAFEGRYYVDPAYATMAMITVAGNVEDQTCGQLIQWLCLASGCWPRADAATGNLMLEPTGSIGEGEATLDNLSRYPILYSNDDLAFITINEYTDNTTTVYATYTVPGNSSASANTLMIADPFIQSEAQVEQAVRMVLSCYGGNRIEITGRGDPSHEIGDIMTIQLSDEAATTARLLTQELTFSDGVMKDCTSTLLQADGVALWTDREAFIDSGSWTCPDDVTEIRLILVGKGTNGTNGGNGTWTHKGAPGIDGIGGKVYVDTITVTPGVTYTITIGDESEFGLYSSASGSVLPYGFTDIASGASYGRSAVARPVKGSGDGGKGGAGGSKGIKYRNPNFRTNETPEYLYIQPTNGKPGSLGATGSVIIYYAKGSE